MTLDIVLSERSDPRLGRHQCHDDRSRAYALPPIALPTKTVLHERAIPIFDQKDLGCCTACAGLGMMATGPLNLGKPFTMDDVHGFYHDETVIDDAMGIPGIWEPDDVGSCGLASTKVLKRRGWIAGYRHAFSLTTTLGWLGRQPVSVGVPWLESMMSPGRGAVLTVDRHSPVVGGHQVCLDGIEPAHSMVRIANSWSSSWGDGGWCWVGYSDLGWLLSRGGDAVTVTLPAGKAA